jgi:hypothetical protein
MRASFFVVSLISCSCAAHAAGCPRPANAKMMASINQAHNCVQSQAKMMTSSGKSANVIASNALAKCRPQIDRLENACIGPGVRSADLIEAFRSDAIKVVLRARVG